MKDYKFDVPADQVDSFKHVPVMKDGEVVDRKIRFVIKSSSDEVTMVTHHWLKNVGPSDSKAQCRINYNAKQQMPLPGTSNGAGAAEETTPEATDTPRGRRHTKLTSKEPVQ